MLRQIIITATLACAAQLANAAEAGKVIFVAGKAQVAERKVTEGASVQEGELLTTGADGFVYVKTIDNGLFILRPNTRARIASYHVDAKDPANTRIKLELLSGVARSRSGDAVKLARQNFRFNTPVAAIGVRGTDFTVFTDDNTSRVAVISGGIVMSGFSGACHPEGSGPCEGNASRELSAAQRGVLLQIQRGQPTPQLMQGGVTPDQVAPPRPDEAVVKSGVMSGTTPIVSTEPNLDAKKSETLTQNASPVPVVATPTPTPTPPVVVTPPPVVVVDPTPVPPVVVVPPAEKPPVVVVPPEEKPPVVVVPPVVTPPVVTPPVPELPVVPERQLVWGRWQPLLDQPSKIDLAAEKAKSDLVAVNGSFALLSAPGKDYVAADHGSVGFTLQDSDAVVYTTKSGVREASKGTMQNGVLNVDFGKRSYATTVDLLTATSELFKLQSNGMITSNGRMYGDLSFARNGYMNVSGALSNEQGGAAAYVFDARVDSTRTVNGVTYWRK